MSSGKTFDLKVGYSCNNKCIHCVIESNKQALRREHLPVDTSYGELVKIMQSPEFVEADGIVLTGGEPTIRKEFLRLVTYIVTNYPRKRIYLQSNARMLTKYLDALHELTNNLHYVIALHSINEEVHNDVVGNGRDGTNPYKETMDCLFKMKELYGEFKSVARIEIVLTQYNLSTLFETIKELHELGINSIGISYPHLDGMYEDFGAEHLKKISFSYAELKLILPEIYRYCKANPDLEVAFEEVPRCMWRDEDGILLPQLHNIGSLSDRSNEEVSVKFPGVEVESDFQTVWKNMHKQSTKCQECVYCCSCLGVWYEAINTFGDLGFTPIKQHEL